MGEVVTHRMPNSLRRDYAQLARFPGGLLVAGDAIASFNPIYGQGMTCAAFHARALRSHLESAETSPAGYLRAVGKVAGTAWALSVSEDLRLPTTRGEHPRGTWLRHRLGDRYAPAMLTEPRLHRRFLEVASMEASPRSLLSPAALLVLARSSRAPERRGAGPAAPGSYPRGVGIFSSARASRGQGGLQPERALAGRAQPIVSPGRHALLRADLGPPFPEGTERALFAMGCFWGAERIFWRLPGVHTTAVGYSGGLTPNPTYEEVCTGRTGHAETVLVVFSPEKVGYEALLSAFFEGHDPTQVMRQGNDVGTQYRSAVFATTPSQLEAARRARQRYGERLCAAGLGPVATEVVEAGPFYYAEAYHQQYLVRNPGGYCGLQGTGLLLGDA